MCPSNFLPNWASRLAKSLGALGLGAERSKKYVPRPSGAQVVALMEMAQAPVAEWREWPWRCWRRPVPVRQLAVDEQSTLRNTPAWLSAAASNAVETHGAGRSYQAVLEHR